MSQIASLQADLKELAGAQLETTQIVQQQEEALALERKNKEDMRRKYKVCTFHKTILWHGGKLHKGYVNTLTHLSNLIYKMSCIL